MDSQDQQHGENEGAKQPDQAAQPRPPQLPPAPPTTSLPVTSLPVSPPPPQAPIKQGWVGQVEYAGKSYAPAGFWLRALAFTIDLVLLTLLHTILVEVAHVPKPDVEAMLSVLGTLLDELASSGFPSDQTFAMMDELQGPIIFSGWLRVAMCALYFTLFHSLLGQTLGKLCVGIHVLCKDGTPLTFGKAALRYLGYFLTSRLLHTAWIVPFDNQRRTLYDMALGTNVFREVSGK